MWVKEECVVCTFEEYLNKYGVCQGCFNKQPLGMELRCRICKHFSIINHPGFCEKCWKKLVGTKFTPR